MLANSNRHSEARLWRTESRSHAAPLSRSSRARATMKPLGSEKTVVPNTSPGSKPPIIAVAGSGLALLARSGVGSSWGLLSGG